MFLFSPRTRGCSAYPQPYSKPQAVFPAHAGMFLHGGAASTKSGCFPRARGDVPSPVNGLIRWPLFSPRTRGCSCRGLCKCCYNHVFPAHAGMFRGHRIFASSSRCFPRARGDVPINCVSSALCMKFSPRTRGCSSVAHRLKMCRRVFPAHAGMFLLI